MLKNILKGGKICQDVWEWGIDNNDENNIYNLLTAIVWIVKARYFNDYY